MRHLEFVNVHLNIHNLHYRSTMRYYNVPKAAQQIPVVTLSHIVAVTKLHVHCYMYTVVLNCSLTVGGGGGGHWHMHHL